MHEVRAALNGQETPSSTRAMVKLLFYSLLMIILPVTFYFSSKSLVFEGYFGMSSTSSYFYAAIVAITTVHLVLIMFIVAAWSEGSKPEIKTD